MIRNDDIVEDFVPIEQCIEQCIEQYSMHTIPDNNNGLNGNDYSINHQIVGNCNEQQNFETIVTNSISENHVNIMRVHEIGFYGWKKKCLYFFIVLVTIAVLINAALTLWIIAVLSFSMDGIGKLKIHQNGLHLTGEAFLLNNVYANQIRSIKDQTLRIQSDDSILMNVKNQNNLKTSDKIDVLNRLYVGNNRVNGIANQFVVRSPDGRLQFLVSDSNVVVATDKLRVNNVAGIRFNGSIQVPLVQSNRLDDELNVLSPTRRIRIRGPQKVILKSISSYSTLFCSAVNNLHFKSKEKMILLNTTKLEFPKLRTAYPTKRGRTYPAIYQLCICADSGKLFIVPPEANCRSDRTVC